MSAPAALAGLSLGGEGSMDKMPGGTSTGKLPGGARRRSSKSSKSSRKSRRSRRRSGSRRRRGGQSKNQKDHNQN